MLDCSKQVSTGELRCLCNPLSLCPSSSSSLPACFFRASSQLPIIDQLESPDKTYINRLAQVTSFGISLRNRCDAIFGCSRSMTPQRLKANSKQMLLITVGVMKVVMIVILLVAARLDDSNSSDKQSQLLSPFRDLHRSADCYFGAIASGALD